MVAGRILRKVEGRVDGRSEVVLAGWNLRKKEGRVSGS